MKPKFATNKGTEKVSTALKAYLQSLQELWNRPYELSISTAFFNVEGFNLVADELEHASGVRILLGVEPEANDRQVRNLMSGVPPDQSEWARLRKALEGHFEGIERDRDLLGFEFNEDSVAKRLIEWLKSGKVEVRRYEKGFLHGKAFIVTTNNDGVLAGSSNFTYAGLAKNLELNIGQYEPDVVKRVQSWFDEIWNESESFDLGKIYQGRYEEHSPYLIYLRMLLERYGAELSHEAEDEGREIRLTTFQRDGVWRAKRILEKYNGVLIADGVGLGKSFIAGDLIHDFVKRRRQRVLLVAPAALRDGPWKRLQLEWQISFDCVSFEQLVEDRQLNPRGTGNHLTFSINDYSAIFIDEAHAFRNPDTQRAVVLRKLLEGTPPKKLILLSATPVNNSLWDLYYLLGFFIRNDAAFSTQGIRSLRDHFSAAMSIDPEDLSPQHLFDILDAVSVRRTRNFVKKYYPRDTVIIAGEKKVVSFPKPSVRKVSYDLGKVLPGFFHRFEEAMEPDGEGNAGKLSLARYAPSRFLIHGKPQTYEIQMAALLKSGLLKRFESSAFAFHLTCETMIRNHKAFLQLLDKGYVASTAAIDEWINTDSDDIDDLSNIQESLAPASLYDVRALKSAVQSDMEILQTFSAEASRVPVQNDPKLKALADELAALVVEAKSEANSDDDFIDRRKVIIFSYFADTVQWIEKFLTDVVSKDKRLSVYRNRLIALSGKEGDRTSALFGFAPRTTEAPPSSTNNRYDILVCTDVLAEGVNLQQARNIINFDLPWNPMRLVQRHGRIDRIGSRFDSVVMRCFFPDNELDSLLRLEERLHQKIARAAASIGVEAEVLPGSMIHEIQFSDHRLEIEKIQKGSAEILESAGEAYSGEEFRQDLRSALQNSDIALRLKSLAWGAGSGFVVKGDRAGHVFCARVADHHEVQFRFVDLSDPSGAQISRDTLFCLSTAHADEGTPRALDRLAHENAYKAWALAKQDIFAEWTKATDPRNLNPRIPRAMRDAIEVLRQSSGGSMEQKEVDYCIEALQAPYGSRIQKVFRELLGQRMNPADIAVQIVKKVNELGLEPGVPPETLPVINANDIHLVCWLAVVPNTL